jgi:GNAT superfamily N-acetyltransferase
VLRHATVADADAVAEVFIAARDQQTYLPAVHTHDEHRQFVRDVVLADYEVWVAEDEGRIEGMAALAGDELAHLDVHPRAQNRGIGTTLLEKTKELRPNGFFLWTHQPNTGACRLYERNGLVAAEYTDGATNEEKTPDVRYVWDPAGRGSDALSRDAGSRSSPRRSP